MPNWIDLDLEFLTPAFVSGADQKVAEIPPASIKGLLRWWWRATVGHEYADPKALRDAEGRIFGSAGEPSLRSPLTLRVSPSVFTPAPRGSELWGGKTYEWTRGDKKGTANILSYLAYGPARLLARGEKDHAGRALEPEFNDKSGRAKGGVVLLRQAIPAGTRWSLRLAWRPGRLTETQVREVVLAAAAWVTLGGVGSRSRKGWGALAGTISDRSSAGDLAALRAAWEGHVTELLRARDIAGGPLPPYPQLRHRAVWLSPPAPRWNDALSDAGLRYRTGHPKKADVGWVGGSATPRRASSVLLTVARDGAALRGVMAVLPCWKDERPLGPRETANLERYLQAFNRA